MRIIYRIKFKITDIAILFRKELIFHANLDFLKFIYFLYKILYFYRQIIIFYNKNLIN
jgi:hypothetical protein